MNATLSAVSTSDEDVARIVPRRTRIDPAHPSGGLASTAADAHADLPNTDGAPPALLDAAADSGEVLEVLDEPTEQMLAAVSGEVLEVRREQLQLQVAQLAKHLRERLRDVDRREAQLDARAAELDGALRASRLWVREREMDFQERESELCRQIDELRERAEGRSPEASQLPIVQETELEEQRLRVQREEAALREAQRLWDEEWSRREQELAERLQQLEHRESELRERAVQIERQAATVSHAPQPWEQAPSRRELEQPREQLGPAFDERMQKKEDLLRAAEAILAEHSRQLEQDRVSLASDREAWESQKARQQEAMEHQRQTQESELAERRLRLEARQDWIERQKAGLEQVRGEILELHRQSLEMRLLAEQLWSQIAGRLSPGEVTRSLAQLRIKLEEQYRLEEQNLQARRDELVALGERIADQHRELTELRTSLREWAAARQTEIEQQAAALVQRELALDEQQERFRQTERDWQSERRRYEQQIRDLASQLRGLPLAA